MTSGEVKVVVDRSAAEINKYWPSALLFSLGNHSLWTFSHSLRVGQMAMLFPIDQALRDTFILAAYTHDVGKVEVPVAILDKSDKLTDEEEKIMKAHSRHGFDLVWPFNETVAKIVVGIHEEGNGARPAYPRAQGRLDLEPEDPSILLMRQYIRLLDAVDSLMSDRPYQSAKSAEETIAALSEKYNPDLVRTAVEIRSRL